MAELRVTGVDVDGLLALLGRHLYTTPAVAVRELVQNAHDSIVRRRLDDPDFDGGRIVLSTDPARRVLHVDDDGAGMTHAEIIELLATIGAGATGQVRDETGTTELIGMFGIGFLSAFVVGAKVTVHTTSCTEPQRGWLYESTGGRRYSVTQAPPRGPGTLVSVGLTDDADALADTAVLRSVAERYCALLPVPVHIGDAGSAPVNDLPPPWRTRTGDALEHPVQRRRRRLELAGRFEPTFEPLCTVDITPDGRSDAAGLAWVQSGGTYGTSDNRRVLVFVRGMLLDDDARELLPRWAGFMGAVIESPTLSPTASREDLQRDEMWHAVRDAVAMQLVGGLAAVAREQPEVWRQVLRRHNEALLGAALADGSLFALLGDTLRVPTSEGELLARDIARRGGGKIHLAVDDPGGFEETVFRAMKVPIANGMRYAVIPFLRQWGSQRGVPVIELGTASGDRQVFRRAALPDDDRRWLTDTLAGDGEEVVPVRFAPRSLPLVVVPDREAALKERIEADESDARIGGAALRLARAHTAGIDATVKARLYVNLDCDVIARLLALPDRDHRSTALALLRAFKGLIGAGRSTGNDLDDALAAYSQALASVLDGGLT